MRWPLSASESRVADEVQPNRACFEVVREGRIEGADVPADLPSRVEVSYPLPPIRLEQHFAHMLQGAPTGRWSRPRPLSAGRPPIASPAPAGAA